MKSRNPLWNPEIRLKSRNSLKIQKSLEKSTLKSRNPLWNPEIHFEIQKSILKSEIHLKSSGFRNLVRRDAPWRTPRLDRLRRPCCCLCWPAFISFRCRMWSLVVSLDRTHVTETAQCCLTFRTRFLVAGVIKEIVSWLWEEPVIAELATLAAKPFWSNF